MITLAQHIADLHDERAELEPEYVHLADLEYPSPEQRRRIDVLGHRMNVIDRELEEIEPEYNEEAEWASLRAQNRDRAWGAWFTR